jgi:hypothetical protein
MSVPGWSFFSSHSRFWFWGNSVLLCCLVDSNDVQCPRCPEKKRSQEILETLLMIVMKQMN